MAVFDKFGDKTGIDLPAEMIENVILIVPTIPCRDKDHAHFWQWESVFSWISFPMAVFLKFGDETDINLPVESIGKVIFISNNTLQRYGPPTTPICDRGKIVDFHKYHFQKPFLTGLVTKLS